MARERPREVLVEFLDRRVFNEILGADDERARGEADKRLLDNAKRSAVSDKKRFHDEYDTAEKVVSNYLNDVDSDIGKQRSRELEALGLPTLAGIRYDFFRLCDDLGIRH